MVIWMGRFMRGLFVALAGVGGSCHSRSGRAWLPGCMAVPGHAGQRQDCETRPGKGGPDDWIRLSGRPNGWRGCVPYVPSVSSDPGDTQDPQDPQGLECPGHTATHIADAIRLRVPGRAEQPSSALVCLHCLPTRCRPAEQSHTARSSHLISSILPISCQEDSSRH